MSHGWHSHPRLMKWLRAIPSDERTAEVQAAIDARGKGWSTAKLSGIYSQYAVAPHV